MGSIKLKKIHYILIAVIAFLLITNPSLKDFKEYRGLSNMPGLRVQISRMHNYFVCSTYYISGEGIYSFAIADNFFDIKFNTTK
jgi:hypothetical protein